VTLRERLADLAAGLRAACYGRDAGGARDGSDAVIAALGLRPGDRVADLGSGGGYYTYRLADAVGLSGLVYAVDVDRGLLRVLEREARRRGYGQVVAVEAGPTDPALPEPVDLVFASASYHHLPDPSPYFAALARYLRPAGRVAVLESRPEGLRRLLGHATHPDVVRAELAAAGYRLVATPDAPRGASLQLFAVREAGPLREPEPLVEVAPEA
jgi:arsenite methyltransferase